MKTASITELKANLSHYLRMVKRGSEVQILERGEPIARLMALGGALRGDDKLRLERLASAGVLRRGRGNVRWALEEPPVSGSGAKVSESLDEDREDRV